jgi:heat shock protein HspQ
MTDDKKTPARRRAVRVTVTPPRPKARTKPGPAAKTAIVRVVARRVAALQARAAEGARPELPAVEKAAPRRPRPGTAKARRQRTAKFGIGHVVKHRVYGFRGVVFDIDPVFANTEEWWQSIPAEIRPRKDQPFYHLLAENAETEYIAYVSEQNLVPDTSGKPLRHPQVRQLFRAGRDGVLRPVFVERH